MVTVIIVLLNLCLTNWVETLPTQPPACAEGGDGDDRIYGEGGDDRYLRILEQDMCGAHGAMEATTWFSEEMGTVLDTSKSPILDRDDKKLHQLNQYFSNLQPVHMKFSVKCY